MDRTLRELLRLLARLDDDAFAFDADVSVRRLDASDDRPPATHDGDRPVAGRPRSTRRPGVARGHADGRRRDEPDAEDGELTGREKFAARRRLKRLERLLEQADREGRLPDLLAASAREPLVRLDVAPDGETATLVVDEPAVDVTAEETTLTVTVGEYEETHSLPFEPTDLSQTTSNGVTTVEVR